MIRTKYIAVALTAFTLTVGLTACGSEDNSKGTEAAAKASAKLINQALWNCDRFGDVDLRVVLPAVTSTDQSAKSCSWDGTLGLTNGNGSPAEDSVRVSLEDGIPATFADYVAAEGLIDANDPDRIGFGADEAISSGVLPLKELKAEGWTYGYQLASFYSDEHQPAVGMFYEEGKGRGLSCTYTPSFPDDRFPDDKYFSSYPAKLQGWLDEQQPKVLKVCSELLAAARS